MSVHYMPFTMWCLLSVESVVKHTQEIRSCSAVNGIFRSVTYLEFQLQRARSSC